MNKTLAEEEKDRELCLERATGTIYDAVKATIGNKKITFESFNHQIKTSTGYFSSGDNIYKTQIAFEKINNSKDDAIEIELHNFMKKTRPKRCNLGHDHSTEEYDWNEWQRIYLTWEDMEKLIEWFQNGRFYDSRTRQAKERASKTGFHSDTKVK